MVESIKGEFFLGLFLQKLRANLVPKKVPIHLPTGKIIEGIRWVNPNEDTPQPISTKNPLEKLQITSLFSKQNRSSLLKKLEYETYHGWKDYSRDNERSQEAYRIVKSAIIDLKVSKRNEAFFIWGVGEKLQGMVIFIISENRLNVNYLVSASWNHTRENNPLKQRGIGTRLLRKVAQVAEGNNLPITLIPTIDAAPFYRKLGFKKAGVGMSLDLLEIKSFLDVTKELEDA